MSTLSQELRLRLVVALRMILAAVLLCLGAVLLGRVAESSQGAVDWAFLWMLLGISVVWGLLGILVGLGRLQPSYWSGYSAAGNLCISAAGLAFFAPPLFTGVPSAPTSGPSWSRMLFFVGAALLLWGALLARRARLRIESGSSALSRGRAN